jgi:hypothetical protein
MFSHHCFPGKEIIREKIESADVGGRAEAVIKQAETAASAHFRLRMIQGLITKHIP